MRAVVSQTAAAFTGAARLLAALARAEAAARELGVVRMLGRDLADLRRRLADRVGAAADRVAARARGEVRPLALDAVLQAGHRRPGRRRRHARHARHGACGDHEGQREGPSHRYSWASRAITARFTAMVCSKAWTASRSRPRARSASPSLVQASPTK